MATWTFGNLRKGVDERYQQGRNFLTPDAGANYERQTITTTKDIIKGTLLLSKTDFDLFKTFYKDTKQGEDSFTYTDCRMGDREANFYGNWTATEINGMWQINLSLIFKPATYKASIYLAYNDVYAGYNEVYAGLEVGYEL